LGLNCREFFKGESGLKDSVSDVRSVSTHMIPLAKIFVSLIWRLLCRVLVCRGPPLDDWHHQQRYAMRLRYPVQLSQGAAIIDMFKDVGADGNIDVCVGKINGFYVKRKVCPAWLDVRSYVLPAYGFDKARYGGFGGEMQNSRLAKEIRVVIKP
jgi:hypothetical protein